MATSHVTIDLSGFAELRKAVEGGLSIGGKGPVADWIGKQVPARYAGFVRKRFDRNSKGGGDWKPLAESTILARRSGKGTRGTEYTRLSRKLRREVKARKDVTGTLGKLKKLTSPVGVSILRNTGTLFNALEIGNAGNRVERIPSGVVYGFQSADHPDEGAATISQIATWHNTGDGVPKRTILVVPDEQTIQGIQSDAQAAMLRVLQTASLKVKGGRK